jgi:hypothetical protein
MKNLLDILTALSSIGTFGAFIMLFIKDKDKQKQIDYLANMVRLKEKQVNLSVLPDIFKTDTSSNPGINQLSITIQNRGETARILDFVTNSPDILIHSKSVPFILEKDKHRGIFFSSTGKNTNACEYNINMIFEDKLHNQFSLDFTGIGSNVTIGELKCLSYGY